MITTTDMAEEFSKLLNRKVHSPYHLDNIIRNEDEALKVAPVLRNYTGVALAGINPDFCEKGKQFLQRTYNRLCKKFPALVEAAGEPYDVKPYKRKKRT